MLKQKNKLKKNDFYRKAVYFINGFPIHLTILYFFVLCVFLLVPFDFQNHLFDGGVERIPEVNGVQFISLGGIRSVSPTDQFHHKLVSGQGITVEAWAATTDLKQKGPARIISYSFDKFLRNFTLGQEGETLVMRLRTTNTNLNGKNPEMKIPRVFRKYDPQHLVMTYDYQKERVFVNGKKIMETQGPGGDFSNWDSSYPLLLGNEGTGNRPWLGKLYLVAIYNRPLLREEVGQNYQAGYYWNSSKTALENRLSDGIISFYIFNEGDGNWIKDHGPSDHPLNLNFLTGPEITQQKLFSSPYENFNLSLKQTVDVVVNILIFIPFGFFLHFAGRIRCGSSKILVLLVFSFGTLFSLCIESLQYFSIVRISSMTDVINNMIGTAIGITLDKKQLWIPRSDDMKMRT